MSILKRNEILNEVDKVLPIAINFISDLVLLSTLHLVAKNSNLEIGPFFFLVLCILESETRLHRKKNKKIISQTYCALQYHISGRH